MTDEWRLLLDRAIAGEPLTDAETTVLVAALQDSHNDQEAMAWLLLDEALLTHLEPQQARASTRSVHRLLAKAMLREKHHGITVRTAARPRRIARWTSLATAVVVAMAAWVVWPLMTGSHVQPAAFGDYRVLGADENTGRHASIERGDRLVAGGGGARLVLGRHCDLALASGCEVTIRGLPGQEQIELHRGELHARIEPQRGAFRVLTPLGALDVTGTEFVTTVDFPNSISGDDVMTVQTRRILVTVAVLSGSVFCNLGDGPTYLTQGANRTFAAEAVHARGLVTATTDLSLTLEQAGDKQVTFHVPKDNKLIIHEVGQLVPGDEINIAWVEEEGKRWIQDIDGRGEVEGKVTGLGDHWIEVTPAEKPAMRFIPPWRGGNPDEGGGLDKDILKKLDTVHVGDRVLLVWEMPEGKRVVDVKKLESSAREKEGDNQELVPIPEGMQGFRGILFGEVAHKDGEHGRFSLKVSKVGQVWEQNKAAHPGSAVGQFFKIKLPKESRLLDQHRDTLHKVQNGDQVEVEVFHVDDGVLTVMDLFRKVE